MERPKKPALRRPETKTTTVAAMDVKRMSSSLNMSTSSLRSSGGGGGDVDRRSTTATVRFAPTPTTLSPSSSSASSAARRAGSSRAVSSSSSQQARPATARPASVAGTRGMRSLHGGSPATLGPKGLRRSWGWGTGGSGGGGGDGEEKEGGDHRRRGDAVAGEVKAPVVRSSSVPRRISPDQEKQHPKRESKTKITSNSKTKASSGSPPKAGEDVSMDRRIPNTEKAPSSVSLNNMVRQSPPRKTTPATIGASWESLPSDLQSIGLEVMSYRDAAEVAAVEALQEASSAEILLRAFADLAAVAAEQSPQQTVDEFLALEATLARSAAAGHAEDWLRAAVSSDLGRFSLYSAVSPTSQPEEEATAEGAGRGRRRTTWLGAAAREVGEETRGWFVGHVERLIDGDAAGTLGQLKRVNDWLDEAPAPPSEAAERLRKKIFGYLLDHVESAVLALNGAGAGAAHGRRK
uniref:DUF6857 domain-containing protein n=1 Tax=Oryza glumipatula TaxID=40148 RepID=A0A0E0BHK1_9ORYZ